MRNEDEARKEYNILKEKGELKDLLSNSTGDWSKDKKSFIKLFYENQQIIENAMDLNKLLDDDEDNLGNFEESWL